MDYMNIIDRTKLVLALMALCVLSTIMIGPEPVKYEKGTMLESAAHKAWVKRQNRDIL